jgi:hypothetical protein
VSNTKIIKRFEDKYTKTHRVVNYYNKRKANEKDARFLLRNMGQSQLVRQVLLSDYIASVSVYIVAFVRNERLNR